jgi:hypothetical protein
MRKILIAVCILFASCSNEDAQNKEPLDPLHYRKEIAALNLEFEPEDFFRVIEKGDKLSVDLFLKAGMSPNQELNIANGLMRSVPLVTSIKHKHHEITALLLEAGADPNIYVEQGKVAGRGYTPVTLATLLIDAKSLKLLLDYKGEPGAGNNKAMFNDAFENMVKSVGKPGYGGLSDVFEITEMLEKHEQNKEKPDPNYIKQFARMSKTLDLMLKQVCAQKDKVINTKAKDAQDAAAIDFFIEKCNWKSAD